jgi:glucosamine--fructose-6-phosphate aminotransferase (isomerizing)
MQAKSIEGLPWQDLIICPNTGRALRPIAQVLPFQAIAHAVSCARGWDPDRPRNLAKAVTV